MKSKRQILQFKIALDVLMFLLLSLMYQKRAVSMEFHELGGIALFGVFLIHKALNWQWICAVTGGILRRRIKPTAGWVVDVLLFVAMAAVLVTGLLISKTLPTAVEGLRWLKVWHFFAAALALALTGIHLGLHAGMLHAVVWKRLPLPVSLSRALGAAILGAVLCAGGYSLAHTEYLGWLSRPFVSLAAPAAEEHAEGEANHIEGEVPGGGKRDGRGKGGGKGLGMGKPEEEAHVVSPAKVAQTIGQYGSIMAGIAILTAAIAERIRKKKGLKNSQKAENNRIAQRGNDIKKF